jgi:hypothetical protein
MIDQKESMLHDVFPKLLTHRSILLWIGGIKSAFYQILQSFLFAPDLCYGYCIVEFSCGFLEPIHLAFGCGISLL